MFLPLFLRFCLYVCVYSTYPHKNSHTHCQTAHTVHHSVCVLYTCSVYMCVCACGSRLGLFWCQKEQVCQPDIASFYASHRHTRPHIHALLSKKIRYSVALLPEDALTVQDLHRSTLLMRGQETEDTQGGKRER